MKKALVILTVMLCASPAMALTFTEDFNSYPAGSTTWGGLWVSPTNNLKLDSYTLDGSLGPRTGHSSLRSANALLTEVGMPAISFSASFHWRSELCKNDTFMIVMSDDPATAALVPKDNSSLGSPINAIAWGHNNTGQINYSFFDGQSWTAIGLHNGQYAAKTGDIVSGTVDAAGNWSASSSGGGSAGSGSLAVSGFTFDTVSIISNGTSSQYSGIDDLNISAVTFPEPMTVALLGVGALLVLRRRK